MRAYPQNLAQTVEHLQHRPPDGQVLSVYADVSPRARTEERVLVAFREECRELRKALPEGQRTAFNRAAQRAERLLVEDRAPATAGLAVFVTETGKVLEQVDLPDPPLPGMSWSVTPRLEPLEEVLDDYERIAVLLFDKERARIYTVFLGQIEERHELTDEAPGKQATGEWFGLAQTRYERHHMDHVLRHAKRATRTLMDVQREHPFDRLFLAGTDEALAALRSQLPSALRARLAGELQLELFAPEGEVLAAALRQAEAAERADELQEVARLFEAARQRYPAIGIDSTLQAASDDRIHRLVVADTFGPTGHECPQCGLLSQADEVCGRCGAKTEPVPDLKEAVVQRSLKAGASIEVVSGEAAAQLMTAGGIGAWTRY